jgi:deoxyribodipyrimidine photo-lyase
VDLPPPPSGDVDGAAEWVRAHLGDLACDPVAPSPSFRGGQRAADAALAAFDVAGYARRRSEVWPPERRGASRLSPYIRHGLIDLPTAWDAVAGGPSRDVGRFRDELLWQEYARHLYARLGARLGRPLRAEPPAPGGAGAVEPWDRGMACMDLTVGELERDGWLVNQTRMWLASQWSVRHGRDWREGERRFFAHLLDGSRAADLLGWQWTIGTATGRPYGFSRWQVEKRAPGLCATCALAARCPIEDWTPDARPRRIVAPAALGSDPDPEATAGPSGPSSNWTKARGSIEPPPEPEAVWLTAESLGDADPALAAHPGLPAVFVFDEPVLARMRLSGTRLVFLAEALADLAARRPVRVMRGDPREELAGVRLAVTYAPVPGFARRAAALAPVLVHPWPWLSRPHGGPAGSYSAWIRGARRRGG